MGRKLGGMSVWGITNLGEWVFGELVSSNLGQCVIWGNWCLWSAATDPPVAGFSAYGGYVVLGPHGRPLRNRGIDSRPLWRLRTRSRGESCVDRPSSARFLLALPPRVERHEAWAGSDQLEGAGATRGPRRPKRHVVVTRVAEATRLPSRGVEPQATNLRVRDKGGRSCRLHLKRPPTITFPTCLAAQRVRGIYPLRQASYMVLRGVPQTFGVSPKCYMGQGH